MPRVLVADRHAVTRQGYRYFLERSMADPVVGEASTGVSVMEAFAKRPWDLLLLDRSLPDHGSLEILSHVRSCYPDARVLVVSATSEDPYAIALFRAGADGLLAKTATETEFGDAVRTVLEGRRYVSLNDAQVLVHYVRQAKTPSGLAHQILSPREFQVFCHLASGLPATHVASHLSVNVKTVSTYRSRVLEKMNLNSNADMTRYALRVGLID